MPVDLRKGEKPRWWGLFVPDTGAGQRAQWRTLILEEFYGDRAGAEAALMRHAMSFRPARVWRVKRRTVYRRPDGLQVIFNRDSPSYVTCLFMASALVWDSGRL